MQMSDIDECKQTETLYHVSVVVIRPKEKETPSSARRDRYINERKTRIEIKWKSSLHLHLRNNVAGRGIDAQFRYHQWIKTSQRGN